MGKNNIQELNEWGLIVFRNATESNLFLERPFRWEDRVLIIDENDPLSRKYMKSFKYSTFNLDEWIPITPEEFSKVVKRYSDIYN